MSIVLFDTLNRKKLFPFTYNHAIADIRMGIFKCYERWQQLTGEEVFSYTTAYLQPLYKSVPAGEHIWVDATIVGDKKLLERVLYLGSGELLGDENGLIAARSTDDSFLQSATTVNYANVKRIEHPWQLFQWNDEILRSDFELITAGKKSAPISSTNTVIQPENIFIEAGANVEYAFLNASTGPIYIAKDAVIMEGAMIRGPFAMLSNAHVKMGTRIYGATTLGPCCVAGGEIKNVVMQGYSNKSHDGYLGDSVIGEWCNMGAGTSNSNVKNTGGNVKIWNPQAEMLTEVGQKCGVIMGDYSRTAINTSINTGSFIGLCCNIFGEGFPPKMVPNFTWGGKGLSKYEFEKALSDIENWKKMKFSSLTTEEATVLKYIFDDTDQ
jgi:UDP-N-acetylglucosamine diphosphorylase/glucosamine-1-phosphate N-acetyltransferase